MPRHYDYHIVFIFNNFNLFKYLHGSVHEGLVFGFFHCGADARSGPVLVPPVPISRDNRSLLFGAQVQLRKKKKKKKKKKKNNKNRKYSILEIE